MTVNSISGDTLVLARRLCAGMEAPDLAGLYLSQPSPDADFRDEFGFVFLDDDTAGRQA